MCWQELFHLSSFPGSQAPPSAIWEPTVAMKLWKWTSNGKGHRRETSRTRTLEALHFLLMPPSDILLAGQIGFRVPNAKGENRAWWDPPRANGDLLIINVIIILRTKKCYNIVGCINKSPLLILLLFSLFYLFCVFFFFLVERTLKN